MGPNMNNSVSNKFCWFLNQMSINQIDWLDHALLEMIILIYVQDFWELRPLHIKHKLKKLRKLFIQAWAVVLKTATIFQTE